MAKRARPDSVEMEFEPGDTGELPPEIAAKIPEQTDIDLETAELEQLLADMPRSNTSAVNVYRLGANRQHSFLFSHMPGEITFPQLLATLRDDYGGGQFRVHGRAGGKLVFNEYVSVEAPKRRSLADTDIDALVRQKIELLSGGQNSNQLAQVLAVMQQGFLELGKTLAGRRDESELEDRFMNRMLQMKTLFVTEKAPESNGVDTFMKGLEFGKTLMEGVGEASELDVLRDAVKTVGPAIMQAMNNQAPNSQAPRGANIASTRPPVAMPRMKAPDGIEKPLHVQVDDNMRMMLVWYVNKMIRAAAQGSDPYAYAVQIVDEFEEEKIREFLAMPDSFERIKALVPDAERHKEWFSEVAKEVTTLLDDVELDETDEQAEDGPAGAPPA